MKGEFFIKNFNDVIKVTQLVHLSHIYKRCYSENANSMHIADLFL